MPSRCRRVVTALLVVLAPSSAWAGIDGLRLAETDPWSEPAPERGYDVFLPGETIHFSLDAATSAACTVSGGTGTLTMTGAAGAYTGGSYVVGAADDGLYVLDCGDDAIPVQLGPRHERLWLDHNGPDALVTAWLDWGTSLSFYDWAEDGLPAVAAYDDTTPWVASTAWDYVLNVALPRYHAGAGTVDVGGLDEAAGVLGYEVGDLCAQSAPFEYDGNGDGKITTTDGNGDGCPDNGDVDGWLDSGDSSRIRGVPRALERLALANLLARASGDAALPRDAYLDALLYWADSVVEDETSWHDRFAGDGNADLMRAELIAGLGAAYDWTYPDLDLERRRAWAGRLADEAASMAEDYGRDGTSPLPYVGEDYCGGRDCYNHTVRRLRNGHYWERAAGLGIAANVLSAELEGDTERDIWASDARGFFEDLFAVSGDDGADVNGVAYWQVNLEMMLRFLESERMDDGADADRWYDDNGWLRRTPRYLQHLTAPDGQRSRMSDSGPGDWNGPSYLMARLADQYDDALTQRLAWDGHNAWTGTVGTTRRDVLDVLWFRDATELAPLDVTAVADEHGHACFDDLGIVSSRTGWGEDAVHFLFRGGPNVGGHDHPDAGSFTLHAWGELVSSVGLDTTVKRTATASTLLVDGWGQHGDGRGMLVAPPDDDDASAGLITYLDNRGTARGGVTVDLATYGADLRPLYRYGEGAWLRGEDKAFTQVDADGRTLDELSRWIVWLGDPSPDDAGAGAILVVDRVDVTAPADDPFAITWTMASADGAVGDDGLLDRRECNAASDVSGTYRYTDGEREVDVALSNGAISCDGCTLQDLNRFDLVPVPGDSCGEDFGDHGRVAPDRAVIAPNNGGGGRLDVRALEAGFAGFGWDPVAYSSGGKLFAWSLHRERVVSDRATLLTLLRPEAPTGAPSRLVQFTSFGGLDRFAIDIDHDGGDVVGTVLVPNRGASDSLGNVVRGAFAVVMHDRASPRERLVAHLVHGSTLVHRGTALIASAALVSGAPVAADIGVTWGEDRVWGSVSGADGRVFVHVPFDVAGVRVNGASTRWSAGEGGVWLPIRGDATFEIVGDGAVYGVGPRSACGS